MDTVGKVMAGCLGLDLSTIKTADDYRFWLASGLAVLADRGVRLALLPGGTGLAMTGTVGIADFSSAVQAVAGDPDTLNRHHDLHGQMAKRFQLFLAAGTTWVRRGDRLLHIAPIYQPDGTLLGEQAQTHLSRMEREWGWARGSDLAVWSTEIGPLGLMVGTDAWYPEVSRILTLQGARVLLAPALVPAPAGFHLALAGMWQEVQQNQVFALENWPGGPMAGVDWCGWSAIYGPCEATPGETGFFAPIPPADGGPPLEWTAASPFRWGEPPPQPLAAELDFTVRRQVADNYPIFRHFNQPLYRRHFPHIYQQKAGDQG